MRYWILVSQSYLSLEIRYSPGAQGDLFSITSTKRLNNGICQLRSSDDRTAFLNCNSCNNSTGASKYIQNFELIRKKLNCLAEGDTFEFPQPSLHR